MIKNRGAAVVLFVAGGGGRIGCLGPCLGLLNKLLIVILKRYLELGWGSGFLV